MHLGRSLYSGTPSRAADMQTRKQVMHMLSTQGTGCTSTGTCYTCTCALHRVAAP